MHIDALVGGMTLPNEVLIQRFQFANERVINYGKRHPGWVSETL
jgi:hypothetical protein